MTDAFHDHVTTQPPVAGAELAEQNNLLYHQIMSARDSVAKVRNPEVREMLEVNQDAQEAVAEGMNVFEGLTLDEQLEAVEEIVDMVFDQDEEALANRTLITEARANGDEGAVEDRISAQKKRYDEIRRQVAFTLGVEIDDTEKEDEEYRAKLVERVAGMSGASQEDIMKKLGFMVLDEETGEYRFNMPKDVFPPHIVDQWERYATSVNAHNKAARKFDRALEDNAGDVVMLDAIRRYAHNNLASSVQEFLQLDGWDLERCRKFITKMLDQRFPTVETRESVLTSEAIINRLRTIDALHKVVSVHPTQD